MEIKRVENQEELEKAFDIRKEIFVQEQGVAIEDEFDQYDEWESETVHILLFYKEKAVGTGRIRFIEEYGKLERICILSDYRKYGLGKELVTALEKVASSHNKVKVKLHGQVQAENFYKKLGYQIHSDVFMEDGIAHYVMEKELL